VSDTHPEDPQVEQAEKRLLENALPVQADLHSAMDKKDATKQRLEDRLRELADHGGIYEECG
jgi:hypothetical protein